MTRLKRFSIFFVTLVLASLLGCASTATQEGTGEDVDAISLAAPISRAVQLARYNADPASATVSGLSAGAYAAAQLHIAYSGTFKGAALFAGGPYGCAYNPLTGGDVMQAVNKCMGAATQNVIPVSSLVSRTNSLASSGKIDPTSNLATAKVFIFGGTADRTVNNNQSKDLKEYYLNYTAPSNIDSNFTTAASHAWITNLPEDGTNVKTCNNFLGDPWMGHCSSPADPQNIFLTQFYGPLQPKASSQSGDLIQFDQNEFFDSKDANLHSVAKTGYVYVPKNCSAGKPCKVHVSLHGCEQYESKKGNLFAKFTGLNEYADTNNIVVIYPYVIKKPTTRRDAGQLKGNPNGCFDWWGYDTDTYLEKSAPQMLAIKRMVDRVTTVPASAQKPPTNVAAGAVTHNSVALNWTASTDAAGLAGYNVYRSDAANGARVKANSSLVSPGTATGFTVTELEPERTYFFVAKGQQLDGKETADSNIPQATTATGPVSSLVPPTGLTIGTKTDTTIALSWTGVAGNTGYNVYTSTTASGARTRVNPQPIAQNATSYTINGLQGSTTYFIVARTIDSGNLLSNESAQVSAATNASVVTFTATLLDHQAAGRVKFYQAPCKVGFGSCDASFNEIFQTFNFRPFALFRAPASSNWYLDSSKAK